MATVPTLGLLSVILCSFVICTILIWTQRWHGKHSLDSDLKGTQKIHLAPVPRIGGLAIAVGLILGTLYSFLTESHTFFLMSQLLLCGAPVFLAGLTEDLTKRVSVRTRLYASFLSAGLTVWVTGIHLTRLDTPPLDWLMSFTPLAILFTCFAVGGMTHAINIIDGLNGLAAGCVSLMLVGMALIAWQVGDTTVMEMCLWGVAGLLGFLVWNFPFGRIFLGDGGAYLAGFWVSECGILLLYRNPGISTWAILLCCFYPVWETLFSIYRRHVVNRVSSGNPDNTHLHHLLFRYFGNTQSRAKKQWIRHGLSSSIMWTGVSICMFVAVNAYKNSSMLAMSTVVFILIYQFMHRNMNAADNDRSGQSDTIAH